VAAVLADILKHLFQAQAQLIHTLLVRQAQQEQVVQADLLAALAVLVLFTLRSSMYEICNC
jgi:hypothetical protein